MFKNNRLIIDDDGHSPIAGGIVNFSLFGKRTLLSLLVFSLVVLGLVVVAMSESVVTVTSTTTVTLPPTTILTTVEMPGGTQALTVIMPGYRIVMYYEKPDVLCIITFRAIETMPPQTVTYGGTVISVPGTTISTVVSQSVLTFSTVEISPGYTTTYTGFAGEKPVEMVFGGMTITMTLPLYGEIREACGEAAVKNVMSIIFDSVPATFMYAFEGMTTSIPQQVVTIPGMTMEMEPFTTTYTTTRKGTTYYTTETNPGSTVITTMEGPGTTFVSTIVKPGGTVISLIYSTYTVPETPTSPATTVTRSLTTGPVTATPTTTTTAQTTTPTGQPAADYTLYIILAVIIVIAIAGVALVTMRKKR